MASADYYLQIKGVEGEAVAEGFTGDKPIQIESWSWGSSNAGSAVAGTGMGTGKASMQDFHFTVVNGKSSVQLALANWKGNHVNEAILTCRKTGGDGKPFNYYVVTFTDCVISSFQEGGSNGSSMLPMCQISFNYAKVNAKYFTQDTKSGQVQQSNNVTYDVKKVKAEGA